MDTIKITHYIRQHAKDRLTLTSIAKACGYSPYYLSRRFRQVRGYTIKQYVEVLKIQCSIERLLDRSSPVSTVTASAITAGYSSLTSFSRTFKQHTGSSPRDYRRESFKARSVLLGLCGRTAQFEHRQSVVTTPHQLTVRAVYPPDYRSDITFMGLFPTAIPKGEPVIGVAVVGSAEYTFTNIPPGTYYLLACEVRFGVHPLKALSQNYRAKADFPITFDAVTTPEPVHLMMRLPLPEDPPITMNFPVLLARYLLSSRKSQ